ncbi:MAG: hypothetical protein WBX01_07435 [Nitrososphaeraceae archaeon]
MRVRKKGKASNFGVEMMVRVSSSAWMPKRSNNPLYGYLNFKLDTVLASASHNFID